MAAQTILIAEDDPDIRDGVRILLAGEGYHIPVSYTHLTLPTIA